MPEVLSTRTTRRQAPPVENVCLVQARAEVVSLGGAVLLALCLLLSAVFIMALFSPIVSGLQRFIAVVFFLAGWVYLLDSVTESLSLVGQTLEFTAKLRRTRRIPLAELEGMTLIHQGLNLEQGVETIELHQFGKHVDRISLGPCWQRHVLEAFLHSVDRALQHAVVVESKR